MQTVVIYDTLFGNTEQIARAIGHGAGTVGEVRVMSVAEASQSLPARPDLLLVGGPTQRHGMSPALRAFIDALPPSSVRGVPASSFDTRYRMATFLSGSAAKDTADRLRKAGGQLVAPPESFFVEQEKPPKGVKPAVGMAHLLAGQLDRAEAWGRTVAAVAVEGGSKS
jgi:flavodoxin